MYVGLADVLVHAIIGDEPARGAYPRRCHTPIRKWAGALRINKRICTPRPTAWSAASDGSTATCSATTAARCVVMSYDYTVLAGTQGLQNHRKKDRLFELAERAAPAGRALRRGRRRPARRHRRRRRGRPRLHGLRPLRASSAGWCPLVGHRRRAAASPATPRCSAAAT